MELANTIFNMRIKSHMLELLSHKLERHSGRPVSAPNDCLYRYFNIKAAVVDNGDSP
jgi:hypothetical protein